MAETTGRNDRHEEQHPVARRSHDGLNPIHSRRCDPIAPRRSPLCWPGDLVPSESHSAVRSRRSIAPRQSLEDADDEEAGDPSTLSAQGLRDAAEDLMPSAGHLLGSAGRLDVDHGDNIAAGLEE